MFIQFIHAPCTRQDEVRAMNDRWVEKLGPSAPGWLGGTYGFTDDDWFVGVVRFESRESAMANAGRPEQDAWWAQIEKLFDGPVEFHDYDDVTVMLDGGSDDAGFVQVMRGNLNDAERAKEMMADAGMLRELRPEIIGATLAIDPDGSFTQTVAFTDEQAAREGERQEMPPEMAEEFASMMTDVTYLDLRRPWFASRT